MTQGILAHRKEEIVSLHEVFDVFLVHFGVLAAFLASHFLLLLHDQEVEMNYKKTSPYLNALYLQVERTLTPADAQPPTTDPPY